MTIRPQHLWQIAYVGSGTAACTGEMYDNTGCSKRVSFSVTTTASGLRQLITEAIWDAFEPVGFSLLTVGTNTIYANLGANYNGSFGSPGKGEAPTSANEAIAAASYATDPITYVAAGAQAI